MVATLNVVKVFLIGVTVLLSVGYGSAIAGEVLDSGQFATIDADHPTKGTVELVKDGDRVYVRLGKDFSTAEGPDVFLLLHKRNPPVGYEKGDYLPLGILKSFNGTQEYQVPPGASLDQYESVVVWCKEFNIVFGAAHLERLAVRPGVVNAELVLSYSREVN